MIFSLYCEHGIEELPLNTELEICGTNKQCYNKPSFPEFPCQADVILFWPLASPGYLCETSLNRVVDMKIINPTAIVVPSNITLFGVIVSCGQISKRSKPKPEAYAGADLSAAESFAISYYYDIEVTSSF